MPSYTVEYFGTETVTQAIADYFEKHGVTEEVRDRLIRMEQEHSEKFFDMVDNYIMGN